MTSAAFEIPAIVVWAAISIRVAIVTRAAATRAAIGICAGIATTYLPTLPADAQAAIVLPVGGGAPWSADEVVKLRSDLDGLLANATGLAGAHVGIVAIETETNTVLYERAADEAFQPASTFKLVVGSAALEKLGPQFRFHTSFGLRTRLLDGLVLHAGGDPFLTAADFAGAAQAVARAGLHDVPSDVSIDDAHFDAQPYPAGWTWDDFAYDYAAPVSAIGLEENVVHLIVTGGATVGAPARVTSAPISAVRTPIEGCQATADVIVRDLAKTGTAGSDPDALDLRREPSGCIDVVGTIPLGAASASLDAAVPNPVVYAYDALTAALRSAGIATSPAFSTAPFGDAHRFHPVSGAPANERPLWSHDSPPLAEFVGPRFWIPSDNFVAEVLLKELGVAASGPPGTTLAGIAYERTWLHSIGVDPATMTLADGCGMSQYDRITPRDLVTILQHDWNGPNRRLILDSLPVGGARGTIEGVAGTPAAGRVFAKTGSMMHVRGLAGYLATQRHGAVTFAFEVDDWLGDYASLAATRAAVLSRIVSD